MKKIISFIILLIIVNSTYSQNSSSNNTTKLLGTISQFIDKYQISTSDKRTLSISIPSGESFNIDIDVNNSTKEFYDVGGKVIEQENARFSFSGNDESISGELYFLRDKKAYSIYSNDENEVLIEEIDINTTMCVNYPKQNQSASDLLSDEEIKKALKDVKHDKNGPLLESFPGATGVLYLDFDGEMVNSSYWGNINCISPNFSNANIYQIWLTISEDFSPFNLNVTTDRSVYESYPASKSQMVIFTETDDAAPGAGGVASFWSFASNNRACFAFVSGAASMAEVGSHEIGHTMGLSHDGRDVANETYFAGHGNWAPIMGTSYTRDISQWSQGEYNDANNTQDDMARLAGSSNGVGYRTDDHSDSRTGATPLIVGADNEIHSEDNYGIIERESDQDYFVFTTTGGTVNFDISPQDKYTKSANLDIQARLLDNGGGEILVSNTSSTALTANLNTTLSSGTYYIEIDGVGYSDPATDGYSDYASVGQFFIEGSYPPGDNTLSPNPSISYTNSCGTIDFEGTVINGYDSLYWDFDDGSSSGVLSPSHSYTTSNTYNVTLTAFNANGSNSSSENITVEYIAPPIATSDTTCANDGDITLQASGGSGTFHWYDAQTLGNRLHTGPSYSTNISSVTSFYVEETNAKAPGNVGPSSNSIGSGGYYDTDNLWGLFFDAHEDFILKSVKIYANSTGVRIFKISKGDYDYNTLTQKIVTNVPQGESRIDFDILIPKGTQYFIQVSGAKVDLYRNTTGSSFPYTYNNVVTITRNNDYDNAGYYYYFYDWEVEPVGCSSERTKVTAWVNSCLGIDDITKNNRSVTAFFNSYSSLSVQLYNFRRETVQVAILNSLGQVFHNTQMNTNNEPILNDNINIPKLSNGIYYIRFSNENTNQTIKLVKTN